MNRCIYLLLLSAALAMPAHSFEWPWQSQQDVRHGYCKGFVMAALSQNELGETSRIDLWLTWNHILRAELPEGSIDEQDFQRGRDRLSALIESSDYSGIREVADEECYLGRHRRHSDEA